MIKDCFGVQAVVGDHIAFSRGNAGAKPFEEAIVTKITEKSICFKGKTGSMYRRESDELRRGEGCFVIDLDKRHCGIIGKSNAWEALDKHMHHVSGPALELQAEVSRKLHEDGCASAWIHHAHFVDALIEKYEESLDAEV